MWESLRVSNRRHRPPRVRSYDRIGTGYATTRASLPRVARLIEPALGDAVEVVNVGAGTPSYEP